ncbi:hypothetical protein LJB42_002986 [Komagataella kurtzmanii]|nr:hypothetical protein LJB42_002986 [Komagataella kurtzmanii]
MAHFRMNMSQKRSVRRQIVIVGAGSYGIALAKELAPLVESMADVVLVSDSEQVIFLPSMVRLDALKNVSNLFVGLEGLLAKTKVKLVVDHVVNITKRGVQLEHTGLVQYDYLVIATGAVWDNSILPAPTYNGDTNSFPGEAIQEARDIVIAGGGPLGVELAGEYASYFPGKSVTLVHSREKLLNDSYLDKVRDRAFLQLHKLGVKIILNRRATIKDQSVFLDDFQLKCDYLINCTGPKANPPPNSFKNFVNDKNEIIIGTKFRSLTNPKVFAIGDVTNFPRKGLEHRAACMKVVVQNLRQVLKGTSSYLIVKWRPDFMPSSAISIGPSGGVGQRHSLLRGVVSMGKRQSAKAKKHERYPQQLEDMICGDYYRFAFAGGCDSGRGGTAKDIRNSWSEVKGSVRRRRGDRGGGGGGYGGYGGDGGCGGDGGGGGGGGCGGDGGG